MLQFIRSNVPGLPGELPENAPAWLQEIHQKLFASGTDNPPVYRVVPNSRRKRFLLRQLGQQPRILHRIINLEQWFNELASQGLVDNLHTMSETQRHLILAKCWREASDRDPGPSLLADIDRLFRDYLGCQTIPDQDLDVQISKAFQKYKQLLKEAKLADRNTLLKTLTDLLAKQQGPASWLEKQKPWIFLEGFHLFLPLELELITQISKFTDITLWMVGHKDTRHWDNIDNALNHFHENHVMGSNEDYTPQSDNPLAAVGDHLFQVSGIHKETPFPKELKVMNCGSAFAEVHFLTQWLKQQKKQPGFEFKKVAVVIPGFPYDQLVREFFPRSGIPFNLAGKGFPLAESRPARILQAALEVIQGSWSREDLSGFLHLPFAVNSLKRPYFLDQVLGLPMYFPASSSLWSEAIQKHGRAIKARSESLGIKFQTFAESLESILAPLKQLELALTTESLEVIIQRLLAIFRTLKLEEWTRARKNIQDASPVVPWAEIEKDQKSLSRILDIFRDLLLHGKEWLSDKVKNTSNSASRADATLQLLHTILADRNYQVMSEDDAGVQVFEAREIQGLEFDVVFALGLAEGQVPTPRSKGYIPRIREKSGPLISLRKARSAEQEYLFTCLFGAARSNLFLCRPLKEGALELNPSPFLKPFESIQEAPTRQFLITSEMEKQLQEGRANRSLTDKNWSSGLRLEEGAIPIPQGLDQLLAGDFGPKMEFSPSSLEAYSECPFRFLAARVLRLDPRETTEHTLLGTLVHDALHQLYERKRELSGTAPGQPVPAFDPINDITPFQKDCEKKWEEMHQEYAGLLPEHRLNLLFEKGGVLDLLISQFETMEQGAGYLMGEKEFKKVLLGKDEQGNEVYLTGRIDRIDASRQDPSQLTLIDFKTGKPDPGKTESKLEDGRLLQLQLYAIAARETLSKDLKKDVAIGNAFYLHLADTKSSREKPLPVPLTEETLEYSRDTAIHNASAIRAGRFPLSLHVDGKYPECSSYCSFRFVCRQPKGFKNNNY